MVEIINWLVALSVVIFGAIAFVAPKYTASVLDLKTTDTTMGLTEIRAASGGLFIAIGGFALISGEPWAYVAIAVAYLGAASGRILSLVLDGPPVKKVLVWGGIEIASAAWLIWANAGAL